MSDEPASPPSSYHGKNQRTPSVAFGSGEEECRSRHVGAGAALGSASWQHRESNQTHSGFGRPTAGLGVFSAAPAPEERLGLETSVCPGGGSSPENYWPGTGGYLRSECPPRAFQKTKLHCIHLKTHLTRFSRGQLKSDSDRGDRSIKYVLSGEGAGDLFEIDESTGDIRTLKRLDREEKAFYVLQAQAVNRHSNQPVEPQSEFIITVQDINDNGPQFHNEPYVASIPEMCPTGKGALVALLSVNPTTSEIVIGCISLTISQPHSPSNQELHRADM